MQLLLLPNNYLVAAGSWKYLYIKSTHQLIRYFSVRSLIDCSTLFAYLSGPDQDRNNQTKLCYLRNSLFLS